MAAAPGDFARAELGGRQILRFRPEGPVRGHLLHFHGGGYRLGAPEISAPFFTRLAAACSIEVIAPRYRLAPEHPFPAASVDALAVAAALRDEIGDAPLIASGDSAGGGLAAGLTAATLARGGPRIDALVLHSPWLDLTVSAPAYEANAASDALFSRASASEAADAYLQGFDSRHPLASPLFADIAGFPPTLITAGAGEVLLDDALRFHAKLGAAGVAAQLLAVEGMEHVAVTRPGDKAGAAQAFSRTVVFVTAAISG